MIEISFQEIVPFFLVMTASSYANKPDKLKKAPNVTNADLKLFLNKVNYRNQQTLNPNNTVL